MHDCRHVCVMSMEMYMRVCAYVSGHKHFNAYITKHCLKVCVCVHTSTCTYTHMGAQLCACKHATVQRHEWKTSTVGTCILKWRI